MPWYIHTIHSIYSHSAYAQVDGSKYAHAVAEPYTAGSLKAVWWVLTGKAFAFERPCHVDEKRGKEGNKQMKHPFLGGIIIGLGFGFALALLILGRACT